MSSDNERPAPQHKSSTSSFADVFKTLAAGRQKSLSPVSQQNDGGELQPHGIDSRRGSRVTFGFESMHRGSIISNSSDPPSAPDFEVSLRNLEQRQNPTLAVEEAENVARSLQWFTPEQSIALWEAASYLIHNDVSPEARKSGSRLLEAIANRLDLSPAGRQALFESIARESAPDVIPARINALKELSDHGRKLDFATCSVLPVVSSCIVPLYDHVASTRAKARKGKTPRSNGLEQDEAHFSDLLHFVVDLITLQRSPPTSEEIEELLAAVLLVCRKTSVAADIKNSLSIFDAVILYSGVPDGSFIRLLEVLCSIHASVKSLSGPTSRAVRNLAKSSRQHDMVQTLYSFLNEALSNQSRNLNVIRGTIYVFTDLIRAYGQEGMPQISFNELVSSLHVAVQRDEGRVDADTLELCLSMLEGEFIHISLQENWSDFVNLIITCSRRIIDRPDETSGVDSPDSHVSPSRTTPDDVRSNILANVARITAALGGTWEHLSREQKMDTGRLFEELHQYLEPPQSNLLLDLMQTERLCFPENPDWLPHTRNLIQGFLLPREKTPDVRLNSLNTLKAAFLKQEGFDLFKSEGLLEMLLQDFSGEDDLQYLDSLVTFLVDLSALSDSDTFQLLVDTLSSPMSKDPKRDSISAPVPPEPASRRSSAANMEPSMSNACTIGLVRMFLRSLHKSASRTSILFETLLEVAKAPERPTDSRLTALKLLFRLRCDSSGSIIVISPSENDFLVAVLCRTVDVGSKAQSIPDDSSSERSTKIEEALAHAGRVSMKEQSTAPLSKSSKFRSLRWTPPAWTYAGPKGLPEEPPTSASPFAYAFLAPDESSESETETEQKTALKVNMWLETIIALLQREADWDVYSYILAHLGPQLSNKDFFSNATPQIKLLRSVLCDHIKNESFHEPPGWSGVKKADVAVCIFDSLSVLISYHEHFAKSEEDDLVRAFMMGIIGSWDGTSRGCIHALSVCCHEIPLSVTKSLHAILDKMSKVITMSNIAVHILEFLALLARLPDVYVNLREEEIRTVFGICVRFLQTSREQRYKATESPTSRNNSLSGRLSGGLRELASAQSENIDAPRHDDVSQYVYTLTYHVMIFWFLSLKLQDRSKHANWITSRLIFMDETGKEVVEEQSQVFIDLMQRVTYSDLGDTVPFETFPPSPADGPVTKKSWIVGMSIVTVETAGVSGLTQITKRQASGTTYAVYQQRTAPVLPHQVPSTPDTHLISDPSTRVAILPSHVMLQMTTTAFPMPRIMQPIPLPDDDMTRRAISSFDRNDIVDGHKIGVVYIDKEQKTEVEILANSRGSPDYEHFLSGLGTKVQLRGAQFNIQGLHPDIDGEHTYAWRDRVTEIVYHVATMMPTDLEADPACVNKKRHLGNDFVNIIFNRSNLPFNFETIPSQFNFVNIVISPVSRIANHDATNQSQDFDNYFYLVRVMCKPGFPELTPAAIPKVISGKNLAAFVRILALNASVFSLVWNREGGEHVSSWKNRLREIKRLRERIAGQLQNADTMEGPYPGYRRNTKPNLFSDEGQERPIVRTDAATDWNTAAENNTFQNLDFSRWSR
ncbi:Tuberous sclerosis 2-like protein [Paecilomyces lecythidis]|uniref:Tuberous sclerosis 2-like protein n=1 Tax=Paecilomyces lecythidis TaxID=3004212 RepID=A0ABR3YFI2_9EURO